MFLLFIFTVLYLVNLYRTSILCITELLRFAGQVRCTLQWWSLCKHFWSTSRHLEGLQEEENFDIWWRAASAGCSWQCGDNPIAASCSCCRLRRTDPPVPLFCTVDMLALCCAYMFHELFCIPRRLLLYDVLRSCDAKKIGLLEYGCVVTF